MKNSLLVLRNMTNGNDKNMSRFTLEKKTVSFRQPDWRSVIEKLLNNQAMSIHINIHSLYISTTLEAACVYV